VVWNITTVSGFVNGSETSTDPVTGETTSNEGFAYEAEVYAGGLCIGASWRASARWLQDVLEDFELIIKAPDSIEAIGEVVTTEEYSLNNEVDNSGWEDSVVPFKDTMPAGYLTMAGSTDKYLNTDELAETNSVTRADLELAQQVIISAAKGDIIRAHRLTTVSFKIAYMADVTLEKTVKIVTPSLTAKGKVRRIVDTWDLTTGEASSEISLAISRHNGSGSVGESDAPDPITRPEPTTEPAIPGTVHLSTYKGGRELSPVYDETAQQTWEGFLTNYLESLQPPDWSVDQIANQALANRTYPYSFVVRGPEITEEHTTSVVSTASQEYLVAIPEDELSITV